MYVDVHRDFFYHSSQLHMQETACLSSSSSLPDTKSRQRKMMQKDYFLDGNYQGHNVHHTASGKGQGVDGYRYMKVSSATAKFPTVCRRPKMAFLERNALCPWLQKEVLRSLRGDGSCEQRSLLS